MALDSYVMSSSGPTGGGGGVNSACAAWRTVKYCNGLNLCCGVCRRAATRVRSC